MKGKIESTRKEEIRSKKYLKGKYGKIPYINRIERFLLIIGNITEAPERTGRMDQSIEQDERTCKKDMC